MYKGCALRLFSSPLRNLSNSMSQVLLSDSPSYVKIVINIIVFNGEANNEIAKFRLPSLTYRLGSMGCMRMRQICQLVVHVGASVNVEVFSLPVSDFKLVAFCEVGVLSQVGRHYWAISPCVVCSEKGLVYKTSPNNCEKFPTEG